MKHPRDPSQQESVQWWHLTLVQLAAQFIYSAVCKSFIITTKKKLKVWFLYIVNTGREGEYLNWLNNLGRITFRAVEFQRSTCSPLIRASITTAALTPLLRLLHIDTGPQKSTSFTCQVRADIAILQLEAHSHAPVRVRLCTFCWSCAKS